VSEYVLDASAVLALLNQETGKERVEGVLADSCIGAVNYCEVLGKLIEAGVPKEEAQESFELLNLEVVSFDADVARLAAVLRFETKKLGLSLGDRSCLALALSRSNTAMTAERVWAKLRAEVKIELIR
jgi:PIN domain nuclease of toxin-antitoxin system